MTIKLKADCELAKAIIWLTDATRDAAETQEAHAHLLEVIRRMVGYGTSSRRANEIMEVIDE